MLGKFLTSATYLNPWIVKDAQTMSLYLEEKYEGQFIKYIGDTDVYIKNQIYRVVKKDNAFVFLLSFELETLENPATADKIIEGYTAYNDNAKQINGTFKLTSKTITENGTYLPVNDHANGYDSITVAISGGGIGQNPYIITTDNEANTYLAKEYEGSFCKIQYSKYRPTSYPISATKQNYIINTSISTRRMRNFIDYWLEENTQIAQVDLFVIESSTLSLRYEYAFNTHKSVNADGSIFRMIYTSSTISTKTTGDWVKGDTTYNDVVWYENYQSTTTLPDVEGTAITFDDIEQSANGWTNVATVYNNTWDMAEETFPSRTIYANLISSIKNASLMFNIFGDDTKNTYNEGEVYKVVFDKNVTTTSYQAESPFEVGDAFAGAKIYFNQNLQKNEYLEIMQKLYDGYDDEVFAFFNVDNPLAVEGDDVDYGAFMGLVLNDGSMLSYSSLTEDLDFKPIWNIEESEHFEVDSIEVLNELDVGEFVIKAPTTITQINRPDILNQLAGKTATFNYDTRTTPTYKFSPQVNDGEVVEIDTVDKLVAKATGDNIGNVYRYVGIDETTYVNNSIYVVMADKSLSELISKT